jgi:hypothetical protein
MEDLAAEAGGKGSAREPTAAESVTPAAEAVSGRAPAPVGACLEVSTLLIGNGSTALPPTATFEPLLPQATNVPLSAAAQTMISTHTTYELPCENENEGVPKDGHQQIDVVHRFTLQRRVAWPLNEKLVKLAKRKEQLALECEMRLVHIPPGRGSNAGVVKTNKGGYQSYHDLFENGSPKACAELRHLVSVALTEVVAQEVDALGHCTSYAGDEACLRPALGELHEAYAWLNVNRGTNSNAVHQHDVERWSAVYFVCDGEPNAPGFACPESGHMIFRCGPKNPPAQSPSPVDLAQVPSLRPFSHSYMSVAPLPGSLWIFPGSVPHAVMQTVLPHGVTEPAEARISIGINFSDAKSPPPGSRPHPVAAIPPLVAPIA